MNEPTEEGLKRYPHIDAPGFYYCWPENSPDFTYPCVCVPGCERKCKGACGCSACMARHQDWLAMGGWRAIIITGVVIALLGAGIVFAAVKVFL